VYCELLDIGTGSVVSVFILTIWVAQNGVGILEGRNTNDAQRWLTLVIRGKLKLSTCYRRWPLWP
jgi:hypothetical protein